MFSSHLFVRIHPDKKTPCFKSVFYLYIKAPNLFFNKANLYFFGLAADDSKVYRKVCVVGVSSKNAMWTFYNILPSVKAMQLFICNCIINNCIIKSPPCSMNTTQY